VDGAPTEEDFARSLADELTAPGRPPVVRQRDGGWHHLLPQPADLGILARTGAGPTADGSAEAHAIGLASDSVIVLLGGARGITAWCARALAAAGRCRIELAGRTPMPAGATLPEAADAAALRTALVAGGMRVPAEIEQQTRQILAGREVVDTLSALRECGSEVNYHVMDVRDDEAVHRLLKEIHGRYGRIDGVVYAAGVTEDRLLADKDPQSFAHVYRTKVDGAAAVLSSLTEIGCSPAFVALFGSVAAVYGNRGQADYAAANDALESMGARWAQRTGNRCLTVHWGPWAPRGTHAGMVTPELVREYARRGIGLIDPEAGAASLLRELAWGDATTTSVVYTATGAGPTDR
jgi:NAD(P)-dependent dehydrogenase (short-subunit alcohol dehydrogenase family)